MRGVKVSRQDKLDAVKDAIVRIKRSSSSPPEVKTIAQTAVRLAKFDASLFTMSRFIFAGMTPDERHALGFELTGNGSAQRIVFVDPHS